MEDDGSIFTLLESQSVINITLNSIVNCKISIFISFEGILSHLKKHYLI